MSDEQLMEVKLLLVGDASVGKSCLVRRYTDDQYEHNSGATVGVDFMIQFLTIDGQRFKLKIWDTAGNERFRALTRAYYRDTHGILLVYDVTRKETFEHLASVWMDEVTYSNNIQDAVKILVGNKTDMKGAKRDVTVEEGRRFADQYGCLFVETSAKENADVDKAFRMLMEKIYLSPELMIDIRRSSTLRLQKIARRKRRMCC